MADAQVSGAIALDYGLKRIGVASGNTLTRSANPVGIVPANDGVPDWTALERVVREWRPAVIVVGIPYTMDGGEGSITAAARRFADDVAARFGIEVVRVDERLSSKAAEAELKRRRASGELTRRIRKSDVDPLAACVLLEQWLHHARR